MKKTILALSFMTFSTFTFASNGKIFEEKESDVEKVEKKAEEGPACIAMANAAFDILENTGNYSSHELMTIYNSMIAACAFAP